MNKFDNCALIVAHPDDEILWAGGFILSHSEANWEVACLCRKDDLDRSKKFFKALKELHAEGQIGSLNDEPSQPPIGTKEVEETILMLLTKREYDLVITHSPKGEYTRHLRHEETGWAVLSLIEKEFLRVKELWMFAYEDGGGKYYPRAIRNANLVFLLPEEIWMKKIKIVTEIYGFSLNSWEAKVTPKEEAFWQFSSINKAREKFGSYYENSCDV
ncbi:MAG: PIG-L family deacetylase [candidate division WOR-3 bacterium]